MAWPAQCDATMSVIESNLSGSAAAASAAPPPPVVAATAEAAGVATLGNWRWYHWLPALGLTALAVAVMSDSWRRTIEQGLNDEESSHILLVPLAIFWLTAVRWGRLKGCRVTARGRWLGVIVLASGWLAWRWGVDGRHYTALYAGPLLMAVGTFVAAAGGDLLVKFLPAVLVLGFLIPVSAARRQQIARPMQVATASVTQNVCATLGMDVVRQGSVLDAAGTTVAVAEACNGMRMVVTLFLTSYLFAFVQPMRPWARALILLAAPFVAVAANVARLVPTVLAYQSLSRRSADLIHDFSGWVMLVFAFLLLTSAAKLFRWLVPSAAHDEPSPRSRRIVRASAARA